MIKLNKYLLLIVLTFGVESIVAQLQQVQQPFGIKTHHVGSTIYNQNYTLTSNSQLRSNLTQNNTLSGTALFRNKTITEMVSGVCYTEVP